MDKSEQNVGEISECIQFLPVEIITNILARLPAKTAIRCRLVSKQWRDLTSTPHFVDLHLRKSIPTIMFESYVHIGFDLLAAEHRWQWQLARSETIFHVFPSVSAILPNKFNSVVLFSHAGIIAVHSGSFYGEKIVIMNPSRPSSESVTISVPFKTTIFGVYFHSIVKEYCSLWKLNVSSGLRGQPMQTRFGVLSLGSNPFLKIIDYPFSNRFEMDWSNNRFGFNYIASPLLIDNCLYWMLKSGQEPEYNGHNDIMEFDVITEEFKVILCPVPLNTECKEFHAHLLDIDGVLSFMLLFHNKITIWRLEDRAKQLWKSSEYHLPVDVGHDSLERVGGIVVMGKHLAFKTEVKLYVCDIVERPSFYWWWHSGPAAVLSHRMSLASLKDCKSTISIDEDGKVIPGN